MNRGTPFVPLVELAQRFMKSRPYDRCIGDGEGTWLSNLDFWERSNSVAAALRNLHVGKGDVVALQMGKGPDFVVATAAAWLLGAVVLPLDVQTPVGYRNFVINDCQPLVLVDDGSADGELALPTGLKVLSFAATRGGTDAITAVKLHADDSAWILYTSGSTGKPKGVRGSHGATWSRCAWLWNEQPVSGREVFVQNTGVTVVDSFWESWSALGAGIPLVVPHQLVSQDLQRLVAMLSENEVTRLCLVPSLLHAILSTSDELDRHLPHLKIWTCSGEILRVRLAQQFMEALPGRLLMNQYGLTESCADVTAYAVESIPSTFDPDDSVPIGRPIRSVEVSIVDTEGREVPVGVSGELVLRGSALASGYVSADAIVRSGFRAGLKDEEPIFATGDVVEMTQEGLLLYKGRRDRQVQVNGYRVELDGVEGQLRTLPFIRECAVIHQVGSIAAFVVLQKEAASSERIRGALRGLFGTVLPSYSVPSTVVVVEGLPRTASGKTAYNELSVSTASSAVERPRDGSTEASVLALVRSASGLPVDGLNQDLFELGATSLTVMILVAALNRNFGLQLTRQELPYEDLTVATLSLLVREAAESETVQVPEMRHGVGWDIASRSQESMIVHEMFSGVPGLYNQQVAFVLQDGVSSRGLERAWSKVIRRHRALRTGFLLDKGRLCLTPVGTPSKSKLHHRKVLDDSLTDALWKEQIEPFDLLNGPLWRLSLVELGDRQALSLTVHHAICDGLSLRLLLTELVRFYGDESGPRETLQSPVGQQISSDGSNRHGATDVIRIAFPTDSPVERSNHGHQGVRLFLEVPTSAVRNLRQRAVLAKTSPFYVTLAIFVRCLSELVGQRQFSISVPLEDKPRGADDAVGCFIRTVAIAADDPAASTFSDLLSGLRTELEGARTGPAVTEVSSAGKVPNVLFGWDYLFDDVFQLDGIRVERLHAARAPVKLPLSILVEEGVARMTIAVEFDNLVVSEELAQELADKMLEAMGGPFVGE